MNQTCAIAAAKLATSLCIEALYFLQHKYDGRLTYLIGRGIYVSPFRKQQLHHL